MVAQFARPCDLTALGQCALTLGPIALLWLAVAVGVPGTPWLAIPVIALMTLMLVRTFVLMHECGHGSLFSRQWLNQGFGFLFGVLSGMPQYVWSRHHNVHHATNGNWDKYRGPLAILTVTEFEQLTPKQQAAYVRARSIAMAPLGGFLYVLLNPRVNWLRGMAGLLAHIARQRREQPDVPIRELASGYSSRFWESPEEFRHMTLNNIALVAFWVAMSWWLGPLLFAAIYVSSVSLAGALGIVLFTVQHNFEHSYATCDRGWCYNTAAIHGTSFLVLPPLLNWFTANIGYHHVHHLSARIPNYRLAECHAQYAHLFGEVRRVHIRDILPSLRYLLWDTEGRRLVTVNEARTG